MYTKYEERNVESVCYESNHIRQVLDVISKGIEKYYPKYIESEGGSSITDLDFEKLRNRFGVDRVKKTPKHDTADLYRKLIKTAIEEFEKDRQDYINIFDIESLEEYEDDVFAFKSNVLRNKCPIIRKTLQNTKAKVLDKYRIDFNTSDASDLLTVVTNLCQFANDYMENVYDSKKYETYDDYQDLQLGDLDTEDYTAYGVIGGGIKSMMLYKVFPEAFPSRSRDALWALWYLSEKQTLLDYFVYLIKNTFGSNIPDEELRERIDFLHDCRNKLAHANCCNPAEVQFLLNL